MKEKFAKTVGRDLKEKLEFEQMLEEHGGLLPKNLTINRNSANYEKSFDKLDKP